MRILCKTACILLVSYSYIICILLSKISTNQRILTQKIRTIKPRKHWISGVRICFYTTPCANIASAQGSSVCAVFGVFCILRVYYYHNLSPTCTILHQFMLFVNMHLNRIRCTALRQSLPEHRTTSCRLQHCSSRTSVPVYL